MVSTAVLVSRSRRSVLGAPLAVLCAAAVVTTYLAAVDPNHPGHYPTCPFKWLTGYSCPGCGSLRAVHDLATGQVGAAFHRNPLAVLAVPFVAAAWLSWARRRRTGRGRRVAPAWLIWTLLAAVILFWLLRNLPGFGWLGP
jgi:hypothetical protein